MGALGTLRRRMKRADSDTKVKPGTPNRRVLWAASRGDVEVSLHATKGYRFRTV